MNDAREHLGYRLLGLLRITAAVGLYCMAIKLEYEGRHFWCAVTIVLSAAYLLTAFLTRHPRTLDQAKEGE